MYMFSEMIVLQLSETIFIMIIGRVWTSLRPRGLVRVFSGIEYLQKIFVFCEKILYVVSHHKIWGETGA